MSGGVSPIELQEFELVEAGPGTALLRIVARASLRRTGPLQLVLDTGDEIHRLHPLPAPPDRPGVLRAGFSVPTALLEGASLSLELPDASRVALPAPRRRARPVEAELTDNQATREALRSEIDRHRAAAEQQRAELLTVQSMSTQLAAQLDEAEARIEAMAEVVRRQTDEREEIIQRLAEAETARIEGEAFMLALRAELDAARAELEAARRELQRP